MKKIVLLLVISLLLSCKKTPDAKATSVKAFEKVKLQYAQGFSIENHENFKVLEIKNPWPHSEKTYRYALINKNESVDDIILKGNFDGIVKLPIEKIVVSSTTHIPALEIFDVENTLVGFPGTRYVSSEKIRNRIQSGHIKELSSNENLNTEILLNLNPNVVVGFGIDGNNRSLETIKNSGIPVIYNGDWVESSPLAKAEWLKFFGVLYDKEKVADSIFNHIEKEYNNAKQLASLVKTKPTVLSGAMHNDIWYLPNGKSTEGQLLKDAGVNYLWSKTDDKGSLKLSFESVFIKAKGADIWLSPSNYTSLADLKKSNENHALFDAYKNKTVYSFVNTTGETGGVLYYELGTTRPDLVLKDIIKICHPELLESYKPFFFKPLN